jgi:hypothetical protein
VIAGGAVTEYPDPVETEDGWLCGDCAKGRRVEHDNPDLIEQQERVLADALEEFEESPWIDDEMAVIDGELVDRQYWFVDLSDEP